MKSSACEIGDKLERVVSTFCCIYAVFRNRNKTQRDHAHSRHFLHLNAHPSIPNYTTHTHPHTYIHTYIHTYPHQSPCLTHSLIANYSPSSPHQTLSIPPFKPYPPISHLLPPFSPFLIQSCVFFPPPPPPPPSS